MSAQGWVVLKFGGTSVSSRTLWDNIAAIARARHTAGNRVMLVHSAITGITDRLEKLLLAAQRGSFEDALAGIEVRHQQLADELQIPLGEAVERHLRELREIATSAALVREVSDTTRARVMATGELMATDLGARFLRARGFNIDWYDARSMLAAEERDGANARASVLSATCDFTPDAALVARLNAGATFAITQGFIARDNDGHTVLLGRGGSDTSAAYLAARIRAVKLEIWTDVPGLFSANPRATPGARLLKSLHYDEAQEIATAGAKVLHPRCILPARQYDIPLHVYATQAPTVAGTEIGNAFAGNAGQVKAVCIKKGITLVSMDSPGMWHQVGFLADAFAVFKRQGLSIDQVSTSETSVTVSIDPQANTLDAAILDALIAELQSLCRVQLIGPCASVSLVGHNIRSILHRLGEALELFAEQRIYMVSQAANDLNITFLVDEDQGDRLVEQLHELLVASAPQDAVMGPSWAQLFTSAPDAAPLSVEPWWVTSRSALLKLMGGRSSAYVYDRATVRARAAQLQSIRSIGRFFYAMKANPNKELLRELWDAGLGLECVSPGELRAALAVVPNADPRRVLFTPNFASRQEYLDALASGVHVTVDNLDVLRRWPEVFTGRDILLRIDTGVGRGHHRHVRTAGAAAKFGIPLADLDRLPDLLAGAPARIVGLHAHVGSGVFEVDSWAETASLLAEQAAQLPHARYVNIGGGLGVPDRVSRMPLPLDKLDAALAPVRARYPTFEFWMEPGRFLVADAGVLLAEVTQVKQKGGAIFVGVATGMNSLIRPALYGAHHDIVNLSRWPAPPTQTVQVVGPICESADVLGHDRDLPPTEPGDVLLIATAGAYGHAMASTYNSRPPAEELLI
jgi:diaminopimelate decarboxylase/aspartate kinase